MDDLIERYIQYLKYERNASPHTIRNYHSDLVQFRDFLAGKDKGAAVDMDAVNALRIRAFLSHLFQMQEQKSSIARKLAAIRAFFKFLARERLIAENPAAGVSTPKLEKKLPRIMTEEEMNTFLDRVADAAQTGDPAILRDRAILEMLYASGLRVSELAGLDLRSVNFGDSFVLVRGKGDKERIVPFGSKAKRSAGGLPARPRKAAARNPHGQLGAVPQCLRPAAHHALHRPHSQAICANVQSRRKCEGQPPLAAPRLRLAPAGRRRRPARHPGNAGPQKPRHASPPPRSTPRSPSSSSLTSTTAPTRKRDDLWHGFPTRGTGRSPPLARIPVPHPGHSDPIAVIPRSPATAGRRAIWFL